MGTERGKLRNAEFPGRYGRNPAGLSAGTLSRLANFWQLLVDVVARNIFPSELGEVREAFLTGTAAEVTPIREIDGVELSYVGVSQLVKPNMLGGH
jgi:hypothetical protein